MPNDLVPVITLNLFAKCDVIVGSGILDRVGMLIGGRFGPSCAIISDTNVAPYFGERVTKTLRAADHKPTLITIPAGEEFKMLDRVGAICDHMIAARLDRQSFVIGLGGGVIGDISGFVAAIFHRGVPHMQIPTTLLAMVDSSIGGKTGVNTGSGKNLIGAIHHPELVVDDIDLLKTLPRSEFNQGLAEIVKHAITSDAEMFEALKSFNSNDIIALQELIRRNIAIKAALVAKDERDRTGERALLNFGHTVGHAIERAGNYKQFSHGEAVSLGIVAACSVSMKKAGLPREQRDEIIDLLRRFALPTGLPSDFPRQKIVEALSFDKKFEGGKVRFVVTPGIASAYLSSDVTLEDIRDAIETF